MVSPGWRGRKSQTRNLEVDVLSAVVLPSAEGDRQGDPAHRGRPDAGDDAEEGLVGGQQGSHVVSDAL